MTTAEPYVGARGDALLMVGEFVRATGWTLDDCTGAEVAALVDVYIAQGVEGLWRTLN